MQTREMLLSALEARPDLEWYSVPTGESPYADEFIVVIAKDTAKELNLYDGRGMADHQICVLYRHLKFKGHKVALKQLETVRWTRPEFTGRGRNVYPVRIFLDKAPNDSYTLFDEVEDFRTVKLAKEKGKRTFVLRGIHEYDRIYLVESGFLAEETVALD